MKLKSFIVFFVRLIKIKYKLRQKQFAIEHFVQLRNI